MAVTGLFPGVQVVKTISPTGTENDETVIQAAIDELSKKPLDKNGFRGAILLKKGTYKIPASIRIEASGIVLRGEGNDPSGTKLVATAKKQLALIDVSGKGNITEIKESKVKMTGDGLFLNSILLHGEYIPEHGKSGLIGYTDTFPLTINV